MITFLSWFSDGVWARAMRERNFAAILDWFSTYFFSCGILILLSMDLVAWQQGHYDYRTGFQVISGSLLLAAAAVVSGWVLGLLFGIPRSLSRPQPASATPASDNGTAGLNNPAKTNRTNTNLEDVSDWLTKTIVGLSLANLYSIPHYVWHKSDQIGAQLFPKDGGAQSAVFLIATYFSIGGFWVGYVGTRTMITLLFDVIDQGIDSKIIAEVANPANLQLDPNTKEIKPATDGLLSADAQLLSRPLKAMNTTTELAAWAAAKARSGELDTALAVLREALKDAPGNQTIKSLFSIVSNANKSSDSS